MRTAGATLAPMNACRVRGMLRPTLITLGFVAGCNDPTPLGPDATTVRDAALPDVTLDAGSPTDIAPDVVGPAPQRRFITDAQGRSRIFHGVNVDSRAKSDPDRLPTLTAEDAQRMALTWGFDFVRYLVFWDAAEPSPGAIDQAYFDRVAQRLDWFAANGIAVMLDLHQDVYAHRYCCDGAPAWAIRDDGLPFTMQTVWSLNYFQPAVERAFDNLFAYAPPNRDLQDHYGDVWVALARRFHAHPAVVGYDLINEPSPGSMVDASEIARGVGAGPESRSALFDQTRLGPFQQRLIDRIRTVDADGWIFVEPRFGAAGSGAVQYLPAFHDPRSGESHVAYAPHLYSFSYEAQSRYDASDRTVARWEAARADEARTQNMPLLMGEFGMDQTFPGGVQYLDDVLQMADRTMTSWAYWSWDPGTWGFWDPVARTENANIAQLVRVYPQRIAGAPRRWSWDRTARRFELAFDTAPGVSGPTEIFLPAQRFFASGYDVAVSDPAGTWGQSWNAARQVLSITVPASEATHVVTITPR